MATALRAIRARIGASMIITMAPQTLDMRSTQAAYFQLALGIEDILTIVHMQYYDFGNMFGCDLSTPRAASTSRPPRRSCDSRAGFAPIRSRSAYRPPGVRPAVVTSRAAW